MSDLLAWYRANPRLHCLAHDLAIGLWIADQRAITTRTSAALRKECEATLRRLEQVRQSEGKGT